MPDSNYRPYTSTEEMIEVTGTEEWTTFRKIGFRFVAPFFILFILSLPFPHSYLPDVGTFLSPMFEGLARWSGRHVAGLSSSFTSSLISDSTGLYLHILNLLSLSILICALWSVLDRGRSNYSRAAYWLITIGAYYLALQLFVYGFNKIFKWQFFLPEPNTLYTTVGETPRDLLYWSVMGSSRPYTIFSGVMEVLAGALLLFRRTRTLGAIAAFGVLVNVVAINFSFDISVKIYSSFLLLLSGAIIAPDAKRLARFFLRRDHVAGADWEPTYRTKRGYTVHAGIKAFAICFILFDVLSPYAVAGIFNDDAAPRPPLHGAYDVETFVENRNILLPLTTLDRRWKRAFVHRRGYLIVEMMDGRMKDYELRLDTLKRRMHLTDPTSRAKAILAYRPQDSIRLGLHGVIEGDTLIATIRKLDMSKLPLLQNEFHWTVDEM